jgi:hypothetical protein
MSQAPKPAAPCPPEVLRLVERFGQHRDAYRAGRYNETQLRREFIDPLFKALGWDVDNEQGLAEAYKDVIHEDAIKVGGATKAPDYCFRIGGTRKFFLEAKKPSIDIKGDPTPAYQLRRYAWSAKLPLSILTDFEELAVYDCRIKPDADDKAAKARILYLTFDEFPNRWPDLAAIFSKDAVLKGAFDKYAETARGKRGTAPVDEEFLREIEGWREALARNFALRNPRLSVRDLNFAVQRTIDRVIFLRMCEDRGIEPYGRLQALLNGGALYARLAELFRAADDKYNAGLFYFRQEADRGPPDELTLTLSLDDKVLKDILARLYYPQSPYEFSVLTADILGQVYEQFLGRVIRLTKGHQAKVEEKPEVRKAGGVYYTPTYIVDYIVQHTVGKLLEGKTPADVGPDRETRTGRARKLPKSAPMLRILDPACGSGSFLLGAYQYLLDWHRDWYVEDGADKHTTRVYQAAGGQWRLTTREKKRILLNNVYGVDIDPQAVEVTKLSLLLKVLEGETHESIDSVLRLFHERALPDLSDNIKCGNSLIGPDFYEGKQLDLFDEEQRYRINAFDWQREFPEAFAEPSPERKRAGATVGFNAVIGNPPYRREKDFKHLLDEIAETGFGKKYRSPRMDLWYYFVHKGLSLLGGNGILGFITNAYWTAGTGAEKLITALRESHHVEEFFFLGKLPIFQGVSGQHMIMCVARAPSDRPTLIKTVTDDYHRDTNAIVRHDEGVITFWKSASQLFHEGKVDLQPPRDNLFRRFDSCEPLSAFGLIRQGIAENPASINRKTNERFGNLWTIGEGVFALRSDEVKRLRLPTSEQGLLRPYYDLCDIGRYKIASSPSLSLIYSTPRTCPDIAAFPHLRNHLARFRRIMEKRRETQQGSNQWWHLHWPRDEKIWNSRKLLCVQMGKRPAFVPAYGAAYVPFSINVFVPDDSCREDLAYFAGLLNSRLLWLWFAHNAKRRGVGLEINGNALSRAPIRPINFSDPVDKTRHDRMAALVQRMLDLHKRLPAAKTDHEKTVLQRDIDATDREIDRLVYDLYNLTDEEIATIEEAHRGSA